jgi:hypothetical protein
MSESCHCGSRGLFGYRTESKLTWYCEEHRLAQWWADARRDGSTRHLIFSAGGTVPVQQDRQGATEDPAMDMSKYGSAFVKADDVRDCPRQERIANVYIHEKYDCPVLEFESGDRFNLNQSNTRIMNRTYGTESDLWPGHVIELSLGHYQSGDEEKETVALKPISRPQPSASSNGSPETVQATPRPRPPARDAMDDEIPF